jgi:transcriptional regulator with XRE-family HTH domain
MQQEPVKPATSYPSIVGGVLSNLRAQNGMHQKDLAEAVGVTQATWSRIESGQTNVTLEHLRSAAKTLGMQPSQVLAFADESEIEAQSRGVIVTGTKNELEIHPGLALIAGAALGVIVTYAIMKGART